MTPRSPISSLFTQNSFSARSTSLFQTSFSSFDSFHQKSRSKSTCREKPDNNINPELIAVTKIVHMLSVKVKKHQYFLFCRMEAEWKKYKCSIVSSESCVLEKRGMENKMRDQKMIKQNRQSKKQRNEKGLTILFEAMQLIQSKRNKTKETQDFFKLLSKLSQHKSKVQTFTQNLIKLHQRILSNTFNHISMFSKHNEKVEVFFNCMETVFTPKLRKVFNKMRELSTDNEIKIKAIQEQKDQLLQRSVQKKYINIQRKYVPFSNSALKSITEQGSSTFSDDQAVHSTPSKLNTKSEKFQFDFEQKTLRKQPKQKQPYLTKKPTLNFPQFCNKEINCCEAFQSSKEKTEQFFTKTVVKAKPIKLKLSFSKSMNIQTKLQDTQNIKLFKNDQTESVMFKQVYRNSDNLLQMLPDLRKNMTNLDDNMGVFQSMWKQNGNLNTDSGCGLSQRTFDKNQQELFNISENQKTVGVFRNHFFEQTFTFNEKYHTQNDTNSQFNQMDYDKQTVKSTSRVTNFKKNVPPQTQAIPSSENLTEEFGKDEHLDFNFSSPIDKMIFTKMGMDVCKDFNKQKLKQNYLNSCQTHKASAKVPQMGSFCTDRTKFAHGNKISIGCFRKDFMQCRANKKQSQNSSIDKFSYKQNWDMKQHEHKIEKKGQKLLFFSNSKSKNKQERKRSSAGFSCINQNQTTARKIQRQIQNMMKSKNRTVLGNLKLERNK